MKTDTTIPRITAENAESRTTTPTPSSLRTERNREPVDVSSVQERAKILAAQITQLSEFHSPGISAIATALRQGTYHASAEKTAEAILCELDGCDGTAP